MTRHELEAVVDAFAKWIGDINQAAEDDDRGPANDSITITIFDDGSGRIGKRFGNEIEDWHSFDNIDELTTLLANEGIVDDVNHFTNIQGPQKCPRSECPDGNHHWLTVTFPGCLDEECDDWEEALAHPAVQNWLTMTRADGTVFVQGEYDPRDGGITYLQCEHCEAWHEFTEAMMDDPDFEIL